MTFSFLPSCYPGPTGGACRATWTFEYRAQQRPYAQTAVQPPWALPNSNNIRAGKCCMQHDATAPAPTHCLATPLPSASRASCSHRMQCSQRSVGMPFDAALRPLTASRHRLLAPQQATPQPHGAVGTVPRSFRETVHCAATLPHATTAASPRLCAPHRGMPWWCPPCCMCCCCWCCSCSCCCCCSRSCCSCCCV